MTSVQDSANIKVFEYDPNNNLTQIMDISGEDEDVYITYNKANLPTAYKSISSSGTRTYGMSYYLNGNKYQETNTLDNVTKTYEYNTAGQLSSESETKGNTAVYSAAYTYTPYGNRAQMSYTANGTTEITDYTYDANNRLTNETSSVNDDIKSAVRYYYDENGNTTAEQKSVYTTAGVQSSNMSKSGRSGGSTMKLYSYDEFNRLIQYNDDGAEATYTYGVDNLRASKTVNGATTSYVWNGQNLASETKNDVTTVYFYDVLGVNGSKTDNDTLVRYIKDPHGNVVATNKDGEAYGTYDYTAFGNQLEATDNTNPFRYCGEYYDEESGLVYLRNRYYNSTTGRFISEDPIKDGVNWYVYAENNPVMLVDPSGEDAVIILNSNGAPVSDYVSSYDGESKLGHMAIVVQDYYGEWHYFSISTEGITKIDTPSWALKDCETFNYWLSSYWSDYDTATYVAADTSASYDYFNGCYERGEKYNWAFNNCSEFVVKGLKEATLWDGTSMSKYLRFEYGELPKNTMNTLSEKFYNNCWNYNSYHKVINDKLWEARNGSSRSRRDAKNLEKLYY